MNFILPFLIAECTQKQIPSLDESGACNGKHMSPILRWWFLPFNKLVCVFWCVCALARPQCLLQNTKSVSAPLERQGN